MDYIEKIVELFGVENYTFSERIKVVELSFEFERERFPDYYDFIELINNFPERDHIEITLKNENDDRYNLRRDGSAQYDKFKLDSIYSSEILFSLEIRKNIRENTVSIYNFSKFTEYICTLHYYEVMKTFAALLRNFNYLVFQIFGTDICFRTGTMLFSSSPQENDFESCDRLMRLALCQETSRFYEEVEYELLPDDFHIEYNNMEGNPLVPIFDNMTSIFSLIYMVSSASIHDELLILDITGQQSLHFNYCLSEIQKNPVLYKIYNWIYINSHPIDKAMIARNILSLHCQFSEIILVDERAFTSILSSYNLYLKDNVTQYIELTNKLADYIAEIVSRTGEYATQLLDKFKSNLFAVLGFFFTVVLANIVSDTPLDNIFTRDITFILEVVLLGSLLYFVISLLETKYKVKKVKESYNALKTSYSHLLT